MLCCGHQIIVVVLVGPPSGVSAIIFRKPLIRCETLFCFVCFHLTLRPMFHNLLVIGYQSYLRYCNVAIPPVVSEHLPISARFLNPIFFYLDPCSAAVSHLGNQ